MSFNVEDYNNNVDFKSFNQGKAGIVENCSLKMVKKSEEDHQNAPDYKLVIVDSEQLQALTTGFDKDKVYPVEYPFYLNFTQDWQEERAAKTAYWLLEQVNHPKENNKLKLTQGFGSAKDFIMYAIEYATKALSENQNLKFKVAVDYGTENNPSQWMRVAGFPQPFANMDSDVKIEHRSAARLIRPPKPDSEVGVAEPSTDNGNDDEDDTSGW